MAGLSLNYQKSKIQNMQVLVVEDEKLATVRLIEMIEALELSAKIVKTLDSIKAVTKWLNANSHPDLIFMDIQLADGLCFEIFEKVEIHVPVIFTTAYNEYALRAFKVNSIDYLLKPIDKEELRQALTKYQKLRVPAAFQPQVLKQVMEMIQNPYKSRFVIRIGEHIKSIGSDEVSCFYSSNKSSFLRTSTGRDFAIDCSLDQLEIELDPRKFFRINRKFVVALPHIKDIVAYSGIRLKLHVVGCEKDEILVSREKVADFKKWLEG
jgi:DNA-binding LytR/AlgR family response regulator